jgi:hypothetical protein
MCRAGALVDEYGRCERCVSDANRRAVILDELDSAVEAALESGLTPDQLREAFELALSNRPGACPATASSATGAHRGYEVWGIRPASSWDEDPPASGRLRDLRRASGFTLEELAAELGEQRLDRCPLGARGSDPYRGVEWLSQRFGVKAGFIG